MSFAYDEFVNFIAAGTTPEGVVGFQPSEATTARVEYLIRQQKTVGLTPDETTELSHYLQTEHLMRLAKARARQHLTGK